MDLLSSYLMDLLLSRVGEQLGDHGGEHAVVVGGVLAWLRYEGVKLSTPDVSR